MNWKQENRRVAEILVAIFLQNANIKYSIQTYVRKPMKISKIKTVAALTAMTVLLSGCDAPYELTETEEGIITNYAAHVVTKFNTDQDQGLTYVDQSTLGDTEEPEDVAVPEDTESSTEMQMVPGAGGQSDEGNVADAGATGLTDLFGTDAVSVDYAGAELTPSYVEDTYYAVDADAGKTYLVLKFNLTNNGTGKCRCRSACGSTIIPY